MKGEEYVDRPLPGLTSRDKTWMQHDAKGHVLFITSVKYTSQYEQHSRRDRRKLCTLITKYSVD